MTNEELVREALKCTNDFAERQSAGSFSRGHAENAARSLYTILEEIINLKDHAEAMRAMCTE